MTYEEDTRYFNERAHLKIKCKHCNHTQPIYHMADKMICKWCNYYIFKNDDIESRYRFKEKMFKEIKNKRREKLC